MSRYNIEPPKVRLEIVAWSMNDTDQQYVFSCYGRTDGTEESLATLEALILKRCPELRLVPWDWSYSIKR